MKKVKLRLQLTLSDSGGIMYDTTNEWQNLPIDGALLVEQRLLDLLTELNVLGQNKAAKQE